MIGTASASQRSRSPGDDPNSMPEPVVLGLEPGAADAEHRPAAADVVERRHLARDDRRRRNVFAPTMSPTVTFSVASAQAASVSQPSKIGP